MKKNLIFLTLLISVLMVSVVSASITGYLVRGKILSTDGATATLKGVSDGVATIAVTTPTGVETVQVQEGETAKVGDVQISASDLKQGTLFKRAGANVKINVVPASKLGAGGSPTGHTHLSDYKVRGVGFNIDTGIYDTAINESNQTGQPVLVDLGPPLLSFIDAPLGGQVSVSINGAENLKRIIAKVNCDWNNGEVALGGGYQLGGDLYGDDGLQKYTVIGAKPLKIPETGYYIEIFEPYTKDINSNLDTQGVSGGVVFATCARIEPTLHQFSQDY